MADLSPEMTPPEFARDLLLHKPSHPDQFRGIPWLAPYLTPPPEGTWPRFMSAVHPEATGSYGPAFIAWCAERGQPFRWWQQLTACRVLEHRADGSLVWGEWLLTLARQGGKSVLLRWLALWRLHRAGLIGEPQLVLHVANTLTNAASVARPALAWARINGARVWESNARTGCRISDGSEWLVVAPKNAYGQSAGLVLVDEAWQILPQVIENGVEPTQVERMQPQLALLSTADPEATALFVDRRLDALAGSAALILEWSAPPWLDPGDPVGWRMASPHWSAQREALVAEKYGRAARGRSSRGLTELDPMASFRCQWLNQWPDRAAADLARGDEVLVDPGTWADLQARGTEIVGPITFAMDDWAGLSTAVVAAGRTATDTIVVEAYELADRGLAWDWVLGNAARHPDSCLVVGRNVSHDRQVEGAGIPVDVADTGGSGTKAALAMLRQVVNRRGLTWEGADALQQQVDACRVATDRSGGLRIVSQARCHLVRAAAMAVGAVERSRRTAPSVH